MIQTLYSCAHYKNNSNLNKEKNLKNSNTINHFSISLKNNENLLKKTLNKTCTKNNKRCELYYSNYCTCFLKKEDSNNASRK